MPKYSQIYGKDLIKVLKKYGFVEHSWAGSHCTLKNFETYKRITIPVHNKPLGKGLLSSIFRQLEIDKSILD